MCLFTLVSRTTPSVNKSHIPSWHQNNLYLSTDNVAKDTLAATCARRSYKFYIFDNREALEGDTRMKTGCEIGV